MAKMETGIIITIKGWVPLKKGDIDGQLASLKQVQTAIAEGTVGPLNSFMRVVRVVSVEAKQVSRRSEAE